MIVTIYKPSRYLVNDLQNHFFIGDATPEAVKIYNVRTLFSDGNLLHLTDDDNNTATADDCTFTYFDCI